MAGVQVGGKVHHCGRWATAREAALARDRLVLYLGIESPLNLPLEARVLGPASASELSRVAVERHRRRTGRGVYIGLRRGRRKAWLAFVIEGGVHHHIGALEDAEALAIVRDRVARHLGLPKHSWNFPDRKLPPLSLEAARVEVRRLRKPASAYKGVSPNGDRFIATITLDYEQLTLGTWGTEMEAARAYDRAVLYYRGAGAPRNFPRQRLKPASASALQREARLQPREWRSSRYAGVVKNPSPESGRPWQAFVSIDGANQFAGAWLTERDAAIAVDRGLRYYYETSSDDLNLPDAADEHEPASVRKLRELARAEYKQTTTSRYTGVHFRAGRYDAYLVHRGKRVWIGRFDTEEEAAVERDELARKLHGKQAKLNFPDDP
jgi:hypothetical protein